MGRSQKKDELIFFLLKNGSYCSWHSFIFRWVYIFSAWDWDTMTPWPRVCHKISPWAESLRRFIEAKAPTPIWWKRVESNVGKWPWFIFLTSYDAIFLPKKNTGAPKKNFLGNLDSESLELLWVWVYVPPAPKNNFSKPGQVASGGFRTPLGLGIPLCFAQGETELIGKLFERVGIRVAVLGELWVDSNGCWWWEDLRHHNGWWAWHFLLDDPFFGSWNGFYPDDPNFFCS